jgi:hypothetical protein
MFGRYDRQMCEHSQDYQDANNVIAGRYDRQMEHSAVAGDSTVYDQYTGNSSSTGVAASEKPVVTNSSAGVVIRSTNLT